MNFENDILKCLEVLKWGGIILYPTDTIWGIGCDATNEEAVKKIYALKRRPDEKSMIILVADEKEVLRHVTQPDLEVFDYLEKTLKPTTVIYPGAIGFADSLVGADGSIAIRICRNEFCRQLIKRFRRPIVSTSANISGQPSPKNFLEIDEKVKANVDYVVQYGQDDKTNREPSSLIKFEKGKLKILRP
ncbi:MAG TPA: L-threonylcarbamoyladenylate synthase [Chitinophagaceae bacterium]|nr:L-threonylcarbamoyladenylate synthase [Chitinophagaceae bacterium]